MTKDEAKEALLDYIKETEKDTGDYNNKQAAERHVSAMSMLLDAKARVGVYEGRFYIIFD